MKLHMPTLVYSEQDCVLKHGKELADLGTKALLVTGKHSSRTNGSLGHVETALKQNCTDYVIFDDIEENPSIETVMKARDIGLTEKVDFVIGIGGGSPMDASKAIALMIANKEAGEEILYQKNELPYLPVAEVPTTAGTGSEVTPYAILTIHRLRTKQSISHRIYPAMALVDSSYLKTAGRQCLVNTAVDALAHLVESILNTNTNEYNKVYSEKGLKIWGRVKDSLLEGELTERDYENLMTASTLAGIAITHTGTSLPHALSYAVTYELGMAHGKAVGIFLAGFLRCFQDKERTGEVLKLLGFDTESEFGEYLGKLLGESGISEELNKKTVEAVLSNQAKLANYPFEITSGQLIGFLQLQF